MSDAIGEESPPPKVAIVLVDYDNLKPVRQERNAADLADNLLQIREWISAAFSKRGYKVDEVRLRFYGGWTDERGTSTVVSREVV